MITLRTAALVAGGGAVVGGVALTQHLRREDAPVPVPRLADQLVRDFDVRSTRGNGDGAVDIAREGVRSVRGTNEYDRSFEGAYGIVDVHTGTYFHRTHAVLMWSDVDKAGQRDRTVTRDETRSWLAARYDKNADGMLDHSEQRRLRSDYPTAFRSTRDLV